MAVYGRKQATDPDMGAISAGSMRGAVYDGTIPAKAWLYAWGAHAGGGGGSPVARGHIHALDANNQPAALISNTAQVAVSTPMGSGAVAAEWRQTLPFNLLATATRVSLGLAVTGGTVNFGMIAAAAMSGTDEKQYFRSGLANTGPVNPAGYTSSSSEGWPSFWVEYQANRAPYAPSSIVPSGNVAGEPAGYQGTFTDPDRTIDGRTNTNEKISKLWIQLRPVGGSLVWDTGAVSATATEIANNRFDRQCPTQLDAGVEYEWRSLVYDAAGVNGPWSAWTKFTIIAQGSVVAASTGTVIGRQTTLRPGNFRGTFNHAQGKSGNLIQLDILPATGTTPVRTAQITATVAPGGAINLGYRAEWADLSWSGKYRWRLRVRDTDGLWSNWSAERSFSTNFKPGTPSLISPGGGERTNVRPALRAVVSDADNTPTTGLTMVATIYDGTHTATTGAAMVYTDGEWIFQTNSVAVPGAGPYTWTARAYDGILYGEYAAEEAFFYVVPPVITSPADGALIQSGTVAITWNESGSITSRRLVLYEDGGVSPIKLSEWGAWAGSTSWDIGDSVINGRKYELAVEVRFTDNSTVESERVTIEVLLNATHTAALNAAGSGPVAIGGETELTAVQLQIGATSGITAANHRSWNVRSGTVGWLSQWNALMAALPADPADALRAKVALAAELELEGTSTAYADTVVLGMAPRFNTDRVYVLTATIQVGINTVESLPSGTMPIIVVPCYKIALTSEADPYGQRLLLESMQDATFDDVADQVAVQVWDDDAGLVMVESGLRYTVISETFQISDQPQISAIDQVEMLRALRASSADGTPSIVVNRDDIGQRHRTKITSLRVQRQRMGTFVVAVEFTEVG